MSNEVIQRRCRRSPTGIEDCQGSTGGTGATGGTGTIGTELDFYIQRTNLTRDAVGPFDPLVLRETLPGTDPIIYEPISPILVTIFGSFTVVNGGAGGEITLDVITKWGTSNGTNTFFRFNSISGTIYRVSAISGILIPPPDANPIIIQWTLVALPPGGVVQVDSDTTQDGAYITAQYINGIQGEART